MATAGRATRLGIALGIALGVSGCDPDEAPDAIDLLAAIGIAEDEVPDALTIDAERTLAGAEPEFDIDRYKAGETHEVLIDAHGQARVTIDPEDPDEAAAQAALLNAHDLDVVEAIHIALAEVDGIPVVAEVDLVREAMEVVIENEDETKVVVVDLATEEVVDIGEAPIGDD